MLTARVGFLLIASLLQTALWLGALRVDPFGMSSAADRASEEIFLRLYPLVYPPLDGPPVRDRVQIVMLDEEQLPLPGEGASTQWPLRYDEYARLIRRVLDLKPKGVFVDLLFDTDENRDAQPLRDLIAGLSPDDPPVVFAAYGDAKTMVAPLPTLPFANARAMRGVVELTSTPNHYPVRSETEEATSAAVVLYNATAPPEQRIDVKTAPEFLVAWGNTVPVRDAADPACADITNVGHSRWRAFGAAIVSGLYGLIDSSTVRGAKSWERLQPCPYHSETGARAMFTAPEAELRARFEGSYVLIGAAIAGSGDTVNSPVHGQLPGVYLHAMALDNLLTFEGRPLVSHGSAWMLQAGLIFLCAFFGGLVFGDRAPPQTRAGALFGLMLRAVAWVLFVGLVVTSLLVFLTEFRVAPLNWGGVLAIGVAIFFAGMGKELLALVRGAPS